MSRDPLTRLDNETLAGHFLLAGIDQRFSDQRELAAECEERGMLQPGTQAAIEARLNERAATTGLPGPILAAPESTEG